MEKTARSKRTASLISHKLYIIERRTGNNKNFITRDLSKDSRVKLNENTFIPTRSLSKHGRNTFRNEGSLRYEFFTLILKIAEPVESHNALNKVISSILL